MESARRQGGAGIDHEIATIAQRQHGLITLAQLLELGLDDRAAQKRATRGRLHRVQEGVYAVGVPVATRKGELLAAVLASGPDAVLSHRSAAELWELLPPLPEAPIDVTAPRRRGRSPAGIASHRDGSLTATDRSSVAEIPCTSPERTILDLAGIVSVAILRRAIAEAEVLRIIDHDRMRRLIRRSRGRRGVARLRLVLDQIHPEANRTRSELERRFLDMCRRASLPEPEVNVEVTAGGRTYVPDFLWRDARLIVEADSRRFHDTDSAFHSDRTREQDLMVAGWQVARCTWEQVDREPRRLVATIRSLLDASPPTGRKDDT